MLKMLSYTNNMLSLPFQHGSTKSFYIRLLLILFLGILMGVVFKLVTAPKSTAHPLVAVFMSNDQVYFGRIVKETNSQIILEEVYYLKANASVVNPDSEDKTPPTANLALIKLGDELHSPEDKMVINKEHVLFYEFMKKSGVIVNAIADYEKNKK